MDAVPGTFFLLLSTAVGSLAENNYNCTSKEFEDCLMILKAIAETDDLALPATRQELHLVCRKLQKGVRCIEDHSFRCFTAPQKRIFNSVVSDSRHVIDDLCVSRKLQDANAETFNKIKPVVVTHDSGNISLNFRIHLKKDQLETSECWYSIITQEYLRYAPCLKNVSKDERKCARQYRKLTYNHDIETSDQKDTNIDDGLKMHCCAFTEFVECQHEHLLRDCGHHADQFFQRHLDRMSGSLLNEHCVLYTHGSNACSFNQNEAESIQSRNFHFGRNIFTVFSLVLTIFYFVKR